MLKIGITGGIGSGKSTVCRIFETFGIPVYYADDRAKAIMVEDEELIQKLKKAFGDFVYLQDGSLNRAGLAEVVFNDKKKLELLNSIVHPAVYRDGEKWQMAQKNVPYTLKENAIMFETGGHQFMDKVITVFASKDVRLERVMKRDGTDSATIEARMDKQMADEEKVKLADFVIYNDGKQALIPQIWTIHQTLKKINASIK
jgi:dephospho-CoA kinase